MVNEQAHHQQLHQPCRHPVKEQTTFTHQACRASPITVRNALAGIEGSPKEMEECMLWRRCGCILNAKDEMAQQKWLLFHVRKERSQDHSISNPNPCPVVSGLPEASSKLSPLTDSSQQQPFLVENSGTWNRHRQI